MIIGEQQQHIEIQKKNARKAQQQNENYKYSDTFKSSNFVYCLFHLIKPEKEKLLRHSKYLLR